MRLLNLTTYSGDYFNFIYNDEKVVLYTVYRIINGKGYFCICIYYIDVDREEILKKIQIKEKDYYNYKVFFHDLNLFVMCKKGNILYVRKLVNIFKSKIESAFNMYLEGDIIQIKILDERYFIVFIEKKDILGDKYLKYRSNKSFKYRFAYLVDLEEIESYFIKDIKFTLGARDYVFVREIQGEKNLFFEEAYREAWEKEFYYNRGIFKKNDKIKGDESLNYIKFSDFIKEIKLGEEDINFTILEEVQENKIVRYLGKDKEFIFYRIKNFETEIEEILKFKNDDRSVLKILEINHSQSTGEFYYDSDKQTVLYEEEFTDYNRVVGIFNKSCDVIYSPSIGSFEDFIEDRYLITYYSGIEDGELLEFSTIKDIKDKKEFRYDGYLRVLNSFVILY
ncbi:MAG: hypothetical protein ACRCYE_01510 [Sarcina sp.]